MKKSIGDNQKKRGRPKTGITPMTGVRFRASVLAEIERWASQQEDKPTKAEAIRRLVEIGLKSAAQRS
jgi:hypothetical protein